MATNEEIARFENDLDKVQDFYTACDRLAFGAGFNTSYTFAAAYCDAADEHGYTPMFVRDEHSDLRAYVYLVDGDGNNIAYDSEVAKDAFRKIDADSVLRWYHPLMRDDIDTSQSIRDSVLEYVNNGVLLHFEKPVENAIKHMANPALWAKEQAASVSPTSNAKSGFQSSLDTVYHDADKIHDYYTAQKVMADNIDGDVFSDKYQQVANEHGYTPKVFEDVRGLEDDYVYLIDTDGNAKVYDAHVTKDTFKALSEDGTFDVNNYEPINNNDINNSVNMGGQFHMTGPDHNVPVFDNQPNPLYEYAKHPEYDHRVLTDADKELYSKAIKVSKAVEPHSSSDDYLAISVIMQNFDPIYDEANPSVGDGNGEYFDVYMKESLGGWQAERDPDVFENMKQTIIDKINNDEFVFTSRTEYFHPEVEEQARELDFQDVSIDSLDDCDFLAGLDDLNKNQNNGLQQ